jgi:hypothetical protein
MSSIVVNGDTSGAVTLSAPAVAGTVTVTLPAASGTMLTTASTFGGTGPAFSAYLSSAQSTTNGIFVKLQANTEEFDTNSNYDNATNYRFTPTVSGYYQINGQVAMAAATAIVNNSFCSIYKNGARFKDGNLSGGGSAGVAFYSVVSALIYFNGSTDYVELYGLLNGTGALTFAVNAGTISYFQGVLVRGA